MFESLKKKKYRDRYGLFIVEEEHLIEEAMKNFALETLIVREGVDSIFDFSDTICVSDQVMKKLSGNVSLNDYIGICSITEGDFNPEFQRYIVMEDVQDPGNVGTILRTALSFGFENVILSTGCADIHNEKTIKASQGAIFHLNIVRLETDHIIRLLKVWKYQIVVTALNDSTDLDSCSVPERYALVFGNEGKGISGKMMEAADEKIRIKMDNFDSLNVAIAAGICMYDFRRKRKERHI